MIRQCFGLLISISVCGAVCAQTSYPMIMSLQPTAAQLGAISEHDVESRYSMFGYDQVLVTGEGVTGEIITPMELDKAGKAPELSKIKIRFTIAPEAAEGRRGFRIVGPRGASTLGQLVVTRNRVVSEAADNDVLTSATEVAVPATICGAVEKAEDVDLYKFHLDGPQTLTFHTLGMRLQDKIHDLQSHVDPIVTIRNAAGSTVAAADNVYAADPFLSYIFPAAGDYFIEVRDVRYQGNRYWQYAIEISDQPYVQTVQPLAVQTQRNVPCRLVGANLGDLQIIDWQPPAELTPGIHEVQLPFSEGRSNPVLMYISDVPVVEEQLILDEKNEDLQEIVLPGGIAGQVEEQADIDSFRFAAKKGDRLTFEVLARRLNSELDPLLWISNTDGRLLIENDDLRLWGKRTYQDSMIENWSVPADGEYLVNIRDVHLRGSAASTYFLKATRAEPDFELVLDSDKTSLTPGTCGALFVRAVRKNGFTGEIALTVNNTPPGVTAHPGRILSAGVDGCIVFEAAAAAPRLAENIRVIGTSTIPEDGTTELLQLSVLSQSMQETYMPGGGRDHWPVEMHTLSVGAPGDILRVKLDQTELSLQPGESAKIEVTIERAAGFDKNVTLDMLFQHLSTKYANTLPTGVMIDSKQSKTLLTGTESVGHITLTAAKDAPAVEHQLCSIMANISLNFVMKATYSSPPVMISVKSVK